MGKKNKPKYSFLDDRIIQLRQEDPLSANIDITNIIRGENSKLEILRGDSFRKYVDKVIRELESNQPVKDILASKQTPYQNVAGYWDKTSEGYSFYVKMNDQNEEPESLKDAFSKIVENLKPVDFTPRREKPVDKALNVIMSDVHIGMNPLPSESIFNYEYNADIYRENLNQVFEHVISMYELHGTFEVLNIHDYGDKADGWDGLTTRGGHKLPQNMSSVEVFDVAVDSYVEFIEKIIRMDIANKIVIKSVTNDNHSGNFGAIINNGVKMIIERLYPKRIIEVETLTKFLHHYTYGDHSFIITHGKDKKEMFKGLPLILNDKTINYINSYLDHYGIYSKYIHVQKGDLHQLGYQRTNRFDYRNFMSFAPPSNWVQHNFGDCYSGYSLQVIPKHSNNIEHMDVFFDMKKKIDEIPS